ncbi:MAG: hypothetical protein J6U30_06485 [Oscillospiraceae bacterium]|nr:hypothetical protein [Oscillospiraceae bacterium]
MGFSPALLIRLVNEIKEFGKNHPKMAKFIDQEFLTDLPEGSIVEITVTRPGQEPVTGNFKTLKSDGKLLQDLKELKY